MTLRDVDGGTGYYGRFGPTLRSDENYFPVGVWLSSVVEQSALVRDLEIAINTYVDLTADSRLDFIEGSKMQALTSWSIDGRFGIVLADEADMWAGPGNSQWTGNWPGQGEVCKPEAMPCGYALQRQLRAAHPSTTLTYANYGKGVTFWESDDEARVFVNEFQDIVSADNYWFTDPNICGQSEGGTMSDPPKILSQEECRLPANYGWTIERLRDLVEPRGSKPVWAFVEVGHPFSEEDSPTATAEQVRAAVWNSIIHGARGIVYFNHSFGGECPSPNVLRDCNPKMRERIGVLNSQLEDLAPVLNSPFVDNALTNNGKVDTAVKVHNGDLIVVAAANSEGQNEVEFEFPCAMGTRLEVLYEDRDVDVKNGVFRDEFQDENAVHLYKSEGNSCGL